MNDAGLTRIVLKALADSPVPMTSREVAVLTGMSIRITSATLARCAARNAHGLERRRIDQQTFFACGPGKFTDMEPVKAQLVHVENLMRGWYNPLTGITGPKLGL